MIVLDRLRQLTGRLCGVQFHLPDHSSSFNIIQLHAYKKLKEEFTQSEVLVQPYQREKKQIKLLIDCPHAPVLIGKLFNCIVKVPRLTSRG